MAKPKHRDFSTVKTGHFCTLSMMAVAAMLLSGCGLQAAKIKMCPVTSVLADTAVYPGFRAGAEGDPAGEAFMARLVNVTTDCDFDADKQRSDSSVELSFRATRNPTGEGSTFSVPYYLAVTYAGQILTKRTFDVKFSFRPGESSTEFTADVDSVLTQIDAGKLPYDYQILVGLQLSESQLNYIRQMGRFTP